MRRRRLLTATLAVFCALALTGGLLWRAGVIQGWFEKFFQERIVGAYLKKIQPKLPFTIEKFEIDTPWRDFIAGRIGRISFVVRKDDFRGRFSGPLEFHEVTEQVKRKSGTQTRNEYAITYVSDQTTLETVSGGSASRSTPFRLELWAQAMEDLSRLTELGVNANGGPKFDWKAFHLEAANPRVNVEWRWKSARTEVLVDRLTWKPDESRALVFEKPAFRSTVPFQAESLQLGQEAPLQWSAESLDVNWEGHIFTVELKELPLSLVIDLGAPTPATGDLPAPGHAHLRIGKASGQTPGLVVEADPEYDAKGALKAVAVKWDSKWLDLAPVWKTLLDQPELIFYESLAIPRGKLKTSGSGRLPVPLPPALTSAFAPSAWLQGFRGKLELRDLDFRWPEKSIAARGLNLEIPWSGREGIDGAHISAKDLFFKHFHARLDETGFTAKPHAPLDFRDFHLEIPTGPRLALDDIPLRIGRVSAVLNPAKKEAPYELHTSLNLDPMPLEPLARGLCKDKARIPPARLSARFTEILANSSTIEPQGTVKAELFDGALTVSDVSVFDFATPVPELDFDVEWSGIKLASIGSWLRFGEMDGVLSGHAKDVTVLGWLPTTYDFKVQVAPLRRSKVVFSAEAMKNFVQLFAGESLDRLPGIANWMAFGWPSRVLGGYNVDFAGISVFSSSDGTILVETLDSPELREKNDQNHYILYGPRFRMPIKSAQYPLIVDAPTISNFVRHMMTQLESIGAAEENGSESTSEDDHEKPPAPCLPPEF